MKKKIAILQSNYIPWKGYFDIIHQVDEFVLYDDVQYTKGDWRNRNLVKTRQGVKWLTIPVAGGPVCRRIIDASASGASWRRKHWETIRWSYVRAPYFARYRAAFESLYLGTSETSLSAINFAFIRAINGVLGIDTKLSWSMDYGGVGEGATERLIFLCRRIGADCYLSGPAARNYLQEERFAEAGIELAYMDYTGYPEYDQLYPPFTHQVSVLDLIFTCGPQAGDFIWGWRERVA
jgi:WbqC-like protein family